MEVLNRSVQMFLCCFASSQPKVWSQRLAWAEYSYNVSFHFSIGMTLFIVVYGKASPSLAPYVCGETKIAILEE